jgi:hypothetical protein
MSDASFTRTRAERVAALREAMRSEGVAHLVSGAVNGVLLGVPLGLLILPVPSALLLGAGLAAAWTVWVAWQSRPARLIENTLRFRPEGAHDEVRVTARTEALHIGRWWGWRAVPWAMIAVREEGDFVVVRNTKFQTDELHFAADRLEVRRAVAAPVQTTAPVPLAEPPVVRWRHGRAETAALFRLVTHPIPNPGRAAVTATAGLAVACLVLYGISPGPQPFVASVAVGVGVVLVWQSWRWFPYATLYGWLGRTEHENHSTALHVRTDGLLYEMEGVRTYYRWRALTQVRPTPRYVFVNTAGMWGVVPRRALNDPNAFVHLLRSRREQDDRARRDAELEVEGIGSHASVALASSASDNPFEAPKFGD